MKDWRPAINEIENSIRIARTDLRNDRLQHAATILQTIKDGASQILTEIYYQITRDDNKP